MNDLNIRFCSNVKVLSGMDESTDMVLLRVVSMIFIIASILKGLIEPSLYLFILFPIFRPLNRITSIMRVASLRHPTLLSFDNNSVICSIESFRSTLQLIEPFVLLHKTRP